MRYERAKLSADLIARLRHLLLEKNARRNRDAVGRRAVSHFAVAPSYVYNNHLSIVIYMKPSHPARTSLFQIEFAFT